ncbi:MAG TPA: hypothetical protein VGP24_13185 [Glaciihabitans sp.]|jgi:hypothetical protein|nr:hypothetical protein [Glaciihabitans sp.]
MNDTTGARTPDTRASEPARRAKSDGTTADTATEMTEPAAQRPRLFLGEAIATDLSEIDLLPLTVFTDDGAEDSSPGMRQRSTLETYRRAQTAGGVDIGDSWPDLEPVIFGSNPAHTAAV